MEVVTDDLGRVPRIEANIQTALRQGRISAQEVGKWRDYYGRTDYETATQALLSRKAAFSAGGAQAPRLSVSEQMYRDYAIRTGVDRPAFVYMRGPGA